MWNSRIFRRRKRWENCRTSSLISRAYESSFFPNFLFTHAECNLSKDSSASSDSSADSFECASKCLNELNNIELCRCHQNNEIGKQKKKRRGRLLSRNKTQFASTVNFHFAFPIHLQDVMSLLHPMTRMIRDDAKAVINLNFFLGKKVFTCIVKRCYISHDMPRRLCFNSTPTYKSEESDLSAETLCRKQTVEDGKTRNRRALKIDRRQQSTTSQLPSFV